MNIEHITAYLKHSEPKNYNYFIGVLDSLLKEEKDLFTMVELGCNSAYYSALFHETFKPKAKNILVEPYLKWWKEFGEQYFSDKKNSYFYHNYIGKLVWAHWGGINAPLANEVKNEVKSISLEEVLNSSNTDFIDILHMDLQGSEYYILEDIIKTDLVNKIKYMFIMTHNFDNINYNSYLDLIKKSNKSHNFISNDSNYKECGDGLIVIKFE